jgi:beta-glucosidase
MGRIYASTTNEITQREIDNAKLAARMAAECIVLLKNNGTLPISREGKIALFGGGARGTVKGGTGSGDVNTRSNTTIEQGFENAGFEIITKDWLDRNEKILKNSKAEYAEFIKNKSVQTGTPSEYLSFNFPYSKPDDALVNDDDISDVTAVYVIARTSGEGVDRKADKGDYLLSENEMSNIKKLAKSPCRLIVVLNVGGIVQMKEIQDMDGVDSIVLMSQLGNLGGDVLVDMMTGVTTPSGHLTDTWALEYMDYPSSAEFGLNNGNVHEDYYKDGIYVGYRYFDTFAQNVTYPFGYGLSYTEFSINAVKIAQIKDKISIDFKIKNTGGVYSGKAVVQIYVSAPGKKLSTPYQELKAWVKSKELRPKEEQDITAVFDIASLASFDEKTCSYIIEAGDYIVRYGEDSRHTKPASILRVADEKITEICEHICPVDDDFEEIVSGINENDFDPSGVDKKCYAEIINIDTACISTIRHEYSGVKEELIDSHKGETISLDDVRNGKNTLDELIAQLTVEEMARMCVGTLRRSDGSITVADAFTVPGAAGDTSSVLKDLRHVDTMIMADGPAGLRLQPHFKTDTNGKVLPGGAVFGDLIKPWPEDTPKDAIDYYQYCTAIPIGWALAQSWNTDMVESVGEMIGSEMEQFGVVLWLAPAMNIHRNPLCGRNFEYYSEDPLIAGKIAAAMTRGVQKNSGRGTTIKHFAANNQEDNRYFVNVHIKERALREIYLKGFEIAVKESNPASVMTSYNLINGIHTANSRDLTQKALRDEWKFDGMVMTDWLTSQDVPGLTGKYGAHYPISASSGCIYAGDDIQMPGCEKNIDDIIESVNSNKEIDGFRITKADLQFCCKNIIKLILRLR